MICFKNISASFDFSWINAPFESQTNKIETINIDERPQLMATESWKSIELDRLSEEECNNYQTQLDYMQNNLQRIKRTICNYLDMNELETSEDDKFPIQFFNLNATDDDIKSGAWTVQLESEREILEKSFMNEKARIENIKRIIWNCFEIKPQKVHGIFTDIFIENFPLTDLDENLADELIFNKLLNDNKRFAQICALKPWIFTNVMINDEMEWPVDELQLDQTIDRFNVFATETIDQQLSSNWNFDFNFVSTLPMDSLENVDIHDESMVNAYNIKVYVSLLSL